MATFSSLQDLIQRANGVFSTGFEGSYKDDFKDDSFKSHLLGEFYNQWAIYLHPMPKIFAMLMAIPEFFMKSFYYITKALETIYSNMFKLFGFFDSFSDHGSFIGQFYLWMKVLGISIGVLALVLYVISAWFGSNAIGRYKDLFVGILGASLTVAVLPQAIASVGNVIASGGQSLLNYNTSSNTKTVKSLAIQPISENTVDLLQVIRNNFDTSKLGFDDTTGYLVSSKASVNLNNINDDNIRSTDFTSWYGSSDSDTLDAFMDKAKNNRQYFGVAMILGHVLGTYEGDKDSDLVIINKVSESHWYNLKGIFSSVYLRYKVNWIAMFAQQIILMILFIAMSIKFVQSVVNVLSFGLFAPVIAFSSIGDTSKIKELLLKIFGTLSGFFFEIALLKFGLMVMTNIESITLTVNGNSSGFFDSLGYWEGLGSRILVYFGVYFSIVSGNTAIERWLGISTRQSAGLGVALGAVGGAAYMGAKLPSAVGAGVETSGNALLGKKHYNPATGRNERTGQGAIGKAQNVMAKHSALKNATSRGVSRNQAQQAIKGQNLKGNNYGSKRDQLDGAIQSATGLNMSRASQNVNPPSLAQKDAGGLSLPATNAQNDPTKGREIKAVQMASQKREGELTNQRASSMYDNMYTPNQQQDLGGVEGAISSGNSLSSNISGSTGNENVSSNNVPTRTTLNSNPSQVSNVQNTSSGNNAISQKTTDVTPSRTNNINNRSVKSKTNLKDFNK